MGFILRPIRATRPFIPLRLDFPYNIYVWFNCFLEYEGKGGGYFGNKMWANTVGNMKREGFGLQWNSMDYCTTGERVFLGFPQCGEDCLLCPVLFFPIWMLYSAIQPDCSFDGWLSINHNAGSILCPHPCPWWLMILGGTDQKRNLQACLVSPLSLCIWSYFPFPL